MKYTFYFYNGRRYEQKLTTRNLPLEDLFNYLDSKGQDYWIKLEEDDNDPNKIIIWSENDIKRSLMPKDFKTHEDFLDYADRYHEYGRKRFAEMPAIRISRENYEQLQQQWQKIRQGVSKYLIFREHDNGYVDILEKDELSPEDIAIMNREEKIAKNYYKRKKEYINAHPEKRSGIWRSPADNEFESDFALYDPVDEQGVD